MKRIINEIPHTPHTIAVYKKKMTQSIYYSKKEEREKAGLFPSLLFRLHMIQGIEIALFLQEFRKVSFFLYFPVF